MTIKERLAKWLGIGVIEKKILVYKIIELPATSRTHERWDKNTKDAVASLQFHPGFVALMKKRDAQIALLNSQLNSQFHKDLREVDWLQAGVFWLNFDKSEVIRAGAGLPELSSDALEEELDAFKQLDAAIERVGIED